MTKQEYIKKESEEFNTMGEIQKVAFSIGLAKGFEIAEGFAEWYSKLMHRNAILRIMELRTTAELLEIYLTENEKK
jgi:hypothetical protein